MVPVLNWKAVFCIYYTCRDKNDHDTNINQNIISRVCSNRLDGGSENSCFSGSLGGIAPRFVQNCTLLSTLLTVDESGSHSCSIVVLYVRESISF